MDATTGPEGLLSRFDRRLRVVAMMYDVFADWEIDQFGISVAFTACRARTLHLSSWR